MKKAIFILGIFISTLTNCSLSNNNNGPTTVTIIEWNLVNVTGGIAGVNHDFELGDIIWVFDEFNGVMSVSNNNTESIEDGLDNGNYNFNLLNQNDRIYLIVDELEFGEITFSTNNENMTIDQNSLSTGQGSDGFLYTFERIIRTTET